MQIPAIDMLFNIVIFMFLLVATDIKFYKRNI